MTFDELALLACLHGDHIRYEDTEIEDENLEITDAEAEQADLVQATRDVAILDDLLILACGEHGLGLLKLSEEIFDYRARNQLKPKQSQTFRCVCAARVNLLRTTGHSAISQIRFCAYIGALISME